jgi:hypothetical protein
VAASADTCRVRTIGFLIVQHMLSVLPDEVDSADTTRATKLELDDALRSVIPRALEVSNSYQSVQFACILCICTTKTSLFNHNL